MSVTYFPLNSFPIFEKSSPISFGSEVFGKKIPAKTPAIKTAPVTNTPFTINALKKF